MSENHWDEPFLRSVALLQAQGQAIEGQAGQLSDLADMQAQRRLKSDLAEYISAHAAAGTLPRDPLEVAEARLERLAKFLSQADDVRTEILNSHRSLLGDGIPSVTKANLEEALFEVAVMRQSLPAQLEALRQQSSQLDWVSDLRGADVHPELLICANILGITLPDTVLKRVNLWAFVRGAGDDFEAVQRRLNQIRQRAEQLLVLHESHRLILAEAESNVALGNHLSALNSLSRCGGTNQENFSDLPYPVLRKRAALFSERVVTITRTAGDLIHGSAKTTDTFERLASTGEAKRALKSAQAELLSLQRRREADAAETAALSGSEFENKCKPSLEAARENLVKANETLTKLAAIGAAKRFRTLTVFIVSLIFVVAAAIAFGFWKQEQNKIASEKAAVEAKVLAEKQAAEAKALAVKQAAEAKVIAEAKALAEKQAAEAKVIAEAKALAMKQAAEAKVIAEAKALAMKQAAEAKVIAEAKALAMKQAAEAKVIAEAKALAEKQAPEATEKRLEWTGKAMQRAGFKEEAVKRTLTQGGTVVAWGHNGSGRTTVPAGLSGVVAIAAGESHTVALKQDGTVVAWGHSIFGETKVPAGLSGGVEIAAGWAHTVALKQDGTVVAWGYNGYGETKVPAGLSGVVAIAARGYHTVALKLE